MDKESIKSAESVETGLTSPLSASEPAEALDEQADSAMMRTKLDLAEAEVARANGLLKRADARVHELEAQLRLAQRRAAAAEKLAEQSQALIDAMLRSSSWRVSSPVRAGGAALRKIGGSKVVASTMARRVVLHGAAYVRNRPALKDGIANVLMRFPHVRARLIRLAGFDAVQGMLAGAPLPAVETVDRLTARGRRIHADLLSAKNAYTK
jgi:O-antigen chain-terminating methyltransferase